MTTKEMKEDHLKLMGQLLHDFLVCNRITKSAYKYSHIGWSRWTYALDGQGTFAEYRIILMAIRMVDQQHSQSVSEETEHLEDEFMALYRQFSYEELDAAIHSLNPNCKRNKTTNGRRKRKKQKEKEVSR